MSPYVFPGIEPVKFFGYKLLGIVFDSPYFEISSQNDGILFAGR